MKDFSDALIDEFSYEAPYLKDILDNKINWLALKYYGSIIGNKYRRSWYSQVQYMLNAYIGETNDLEKLADPGIRAKINKAIDDYCAVHPEQYKLHLGNSYKFNPYPNDHERLDDVPDIDPTKNVTDIISSEWQVDGLIYDIDSKNTAEHGKGTESMHKADAIMYNDQDTGEIVFYLTKYGNRDLRLGLNTYTEICRIPGPTNYKRLVFTAGFPTITDFANKDFDTTCLIPRLSLQAMSFLKQIAEKNSNYVSQHLDKYGQKGQDLVDAYDDFIERAKDVFSISYAVVDRNVKNYAMYNVKVVFADASGQLDYVILKNVSSGEVTTLNRDFK